MMPRSEGDDPNDSRSSCSAEASCNEPEADGSPWVAGTTVVGCAARAASMARSSAGSSANQHLRMVDVLGLHILHADDLAQRRPRMSRGNG